LKRLGRFVWQALVAGFLLLAPIYLAVLLVLKAMKSIAGVVRPLARLVPESFPAERLLSFLAVFLLCILVGIGLRTRLGQAARGRIETSLCRKIPGYDVIRGMTRQLAGQREESTWQPALAEIEDALVPAFIVEALEDGRFTVFVPSAPTPFAGAIYILTPERVHPLHIPLARALKAVARWGAGSQDLVHAMQEMPLTK